MADPLNLMTDPNQSTDIQDYLYFMNNGYMYECNTAQNSPPHLNKEECAKVASFITEEYELLRKVFSFLPLIHLNAAEEVCRSWAVAAKAEKLSRGWPYWFVFKKESPTVCWERFLDGIYCKPSLCLWISRQDFKQYQIVDKGEPMRCLHLMNEIQDLLKEIECPLVSVAASGIVGTTTDLQKTREGSTHTGDDWCAACILLLPSYPGVVINQFKFTQRDCRRFREGSISNDWIRNIVGGPNKPITCLLLFCKNSTLAPSLLARRLQERQEQRIAIGGAVIDCVELNEREEHVVGIAFYGENMSASSMVLNQTVTAESEIDLNIKKFREGTLVGEHNLGVMFSCVGRGLNDDGIRDQVESTLFRNHFKNTPLHGVIGSGEIGWDCLPGTSEENKPKKSKSKGFLQMLHSYTTVFVHLAFNVEN